MDEMISMVVLNCILSFFCDFSDYFALFSRIVLFLHKYFSYEKKSFVIDG